MNHESFCSSTSIENKFEGEDDTIFFEEKRSKSGVWTKEEDRRLLVAYNNQF